MITATIKENEIGRMWSTNEKSKRKRHLEDIDAYERIL
jgi:hypothetical protein